MSVPRIIALTASILCCAMLPTAFSPYGAHAEARAKAALNAAGEGRRVYLKLNCYGCHGMNAAGGMGPNIQQAEQGDVSEAVMDGEDGGMPSFRNYANATDVNNLTAYLATIGTPQEPTWVDWWKPNPSR